MIGRAPATVRTRSTVSSRKLRASSAASGARSGGQSRVFTAPTRRAFALIAQPTARPAPAMPPSCHAADPRSGLTFLPVLDSPLADIVNCTSQPKEAAMPDDFEYVSQSRLEYRHG